MANLDFFAAHDDLVALFTFLFEQTDARVFELSSAYGQELREFRSIAELEAAYPLGADPHGSGFGITLQLWSPSVVPTKPLERIELDPRFCEGHTFRYTLRSGGLMQLYLGGAHETWLTKSHFGHFSYKGAAKWKVEEGVDWQALSRLSNRIQYHIRKRLAVASVPGRPILPHAYTLAKQGFRLVEAANTRSYELS